MRRLRALTFGLALLGVACGSRTDLELFTTRGDAGSPSQGDSGVGPGDTGVARPDTSVPPARECLLLGAPSAATSGGDLTWLWDGTGWVQPAPAAEPPTREGAAVAVVAGQVVVFGGGVPGGPAGSLLNDTWVWGGAAWVSMQPKVSPPARKNAAFATLGDRAVLFGGEPNLDDTWVWNGSSWAEQSPVHSPPARYGAAAAALGTVVVLFGGIQAASGELFRDTWQWDGADWTALSPTTTPAPRGGAAVATFQGSIVLFGGITSPAFSSETAPSTVQNLRPFAMGRQAYSARPASSRHRFASAQQRKPVE